MAIAAEDRSTDAVTRLCYYRDLPASTWSRLVLQAAEEHGRDRETLEQEITDSLLRLLAESAIQSPTLLTYLDHALVSSDSTRLVRPAYLARTITRLPDLSLPIVEAAFKSINATRMHAKDTSYLSDSPAATAQGVFDTIHNLILRSRNESDDLPETTTWVRHFLLHLPHKLTSRTLPAETFTRLKDALETATETLSESLSSLYETLSVVTSRISYSGNRRRPFPSLASPPPAQDMQLFVASFYAQRPRDIPVDWTQRLLGLIGYRQSQASIAGLDSEQAASQAFEDLLDSSARVYRHCISTEEVQSSLILNKLPSLLSSVIASLEELRTALQEAVKVLRPSETGEKNDTYERQGLLAALTRESIISEDLALSVDDRIPKESLERPDISDHTSRLNSGDSEEIKHILEEIVNDARIRLACSRTIVEVIASHAAASDLPALATICDALSDNATALRIILTLVSPRDLLSPIRETLDSFDASHDNFGESNLIERFGTLVLFVETVVHRFNLLDDLSHHLGSSRSFLSSWIPTSSAAYALPALDEDSRAAVGGFIGALFGDGISDDLMHATNPRTLLRVAPTILKQGLVACQAGAVDLDSLKDALSYFLQELLSFTLPGVLRWLIVEIERTPPSQGQTAMFEILEVILFAETLPQQVLELISLDLAHLISTISTSTPSPFDSLRAKKLVIGFLPKNERRSLSVGIAGSSPTWVDQVQASLSNLVTSPTSKDSDESAFIFVESMQHLVRHVSSSTIARHILLRLLYLTSILPNPPPRKPSPSQEALFQRWLGIERLGSFIFSSTLDSSSQLLYSLVTDVLPTIFRSTAFSASATDPMERVKVEMLADIVGGSFVAALSSSEGDQRRHEEVKMLLDRFSRGVPATQEKQSKLEEQGRQGDEEDQPILLSRLLIDRLSSWKRLGEVSPMFLQLSSKS